ncbi:hypothetical protein KX753_25150, partial [Escherichia coli]|nr:hypothetical protein [Escherichia coli]
VEQKATCVFAEPQFRPAVVESVARGSFQGETPGIFIVLSGFATSGLSVDFCDARQGGGAYGKTPAALASSGALLFAHMFFPALSPDSVDNRITAFE